MRDWYTKTTLTAILGLLAWNTVARHPVVPTVHAESGQYAIEVVTANAHRELPFKKWGSTAIFIRACNSSQHGIEGT